MQKHLFTIVFLISSFGLSAQLVPKYWSISRVDTVRANSHFLYPKGRQLPEGHRFIRSLDNNWIIVRAEKDTPIQNAQVIDNEWKWSPKASKLALENPNKIHTFVLTYDQLPDERLLGRKRIGSHLSYRVHETIQGIREKFLMDPHLIWIDVASTPIEESLVRQHNLSVNDVLLAHHHYGDMYGMPVSVKEQRYNVADLDIKGISDTTERSHPGVTAHATDMATLISGRGVSFLNGQGVSSSSLISTSFNELFPEPVSYFENYAIHVQNHSFGVGVENFYGAEAKAYDDISVDKPELLHVFSAGNSGEFTALEGKYVGLQQISNLTGTFKQSKNVLVVGAIDSAYQVKFYSSRGPTYDGRIKPELVAYGGEGSSDAAAVVSGMASYLMDYSMKEMSITLSAAETKAILIASAEEIDEPGPDYLNGFGNVSLYRALETINNALWETGETTGTLQSHLITIPYNISSLRIVLYWHDPSAPINEPEALINDLDLTVTDPNGVTTLPLTLSSYPHLDSLLAPAKQGVDRLNNVELVSIEDPTEGTYTISVDPHRLVTTSQSYKIAYHYEEKEVFQWKYPTASNPLEAGSTKLVRWKSTLSESSGSFWLVYPDDSQVLIDTNIDLTSGYLGLTLPDTTASVRFMIQTGTSNYYSDETHIHPLTNPNIYLNCEDQLTFNWLNLRGVNSYEVYNEDELLLNIPSTDTIVSIDPGDLASSFISVRPIFSGQDGIRSYALNYQQQGAGCYIASLLVRQSEFNVVRIELSLNGISLIESASIIRKTALGNSVISTTQNPPSTFTIIDQEVEPGIITYQAELHLTSGETILSEEQTIYYTDGSTHIIFPNPASRSDYLSVISDAVGGFIQIIDSGGKLAIQWPIVNEIEYIPLFSLRQGFYLYRIEQEKRVLDQGKILVK